MPNNVASALPPAIDTETIFHPAAPQTIDNPYPAYAHLRQLGSLVWSPKLNSWLLPTFRGIELLLKDKRFAAGRPRVESFFSLLTPEEGAQFSPLKENLCRQALFSDGPDHVRLRNSFARAFTPAMVERLKPEIYKIAEKLILSVAHKPTWDVIAEIAYPLPVLVIGALLGVPDEDRDRLKKWSDDYASFIGQPLRTFAIAQAAQNSLFEMEAYFKPLLAERRKNPKDDLLSQFVSRADRDSTMGEAEIIANATLVLVAGHETTTNLIGNGILALLSTPMVWNACVSGHADLGVVIEELLRYDSPVQISSRVASEDVVWEGQRIRSGQRVFALLGSANRDESIYAEADKLDVYREGNRHLSFGQGLHFCPGAMLSRIEGKIVLELLTKQMPNLKLADSEPRQWRNQLSLRGLAALPVTHGISG